MPNTYRRFLCSLGFTASLLCLITTACSADIPVEMIGCPNPKSAVKDITFVAFDTETTGFGTEHHRLVEIGAVKFKGGKIVEEKTWLINPERYIPYFARQVHHISNDMVKDCPTFAEMYPEFLEFTDGAVLVAHNANFDVGFIRAEAVRSKLVPPQNPVIDTLPLFRTWFPEAKSHSLEPLTEYLKMGKGTYHRATDDSRYLALIMQKEAQKRKGKRYTFADVYEDAHGVLRF